MATIFNANTTEGLVITPDTSGEMVFQSNGTQVLKVTGAAGSFDVPVGTTAERPTSPTTGTIRYNTTEGALETYDGSAWTSVGASTWTTTGSNIYYNTGFVGIGTSTPDADLHVSSTTTNALIRVSSNDANIAGIDFGDVSDTDAGRIRYYNTDNSLRFSTVATERMRLDSSGNLLFNSGYGSVANAYACRAWIDFNGSTNAIRASGNVSSITDYGTGNFGINFSTAMPDTNYAVTGSASRNDTADGNTGVVSARRISTAYQTTSIRIATQDNSNTAGTNTDFNKTHVVIHR